MMDHLEIGARLHLVSACYLLHTTQEPVPARERIEEQAGPRLPPVRSSDRAASVMSAPVSNRHTHRGSVRKKPPEKAAFSYCSAHL